MRSKLTGYQKGLSRNVEFIRFLLYNLLIINNRNFGKCYYETVPKMVIQGLLAERNGEQRVYVVTVNTPPEYHWIHDRWPRLVKLPHQREATISD